MQFHFVSESAEETPIQAQTFSVVNVIPKLFGDGRRFKQVLMNLVKNALKFTCEGSVEIQACYKPEPENLLIVHVKDTGIGIES